LGTSDLHKLSLALKKYHPTSGFMYTTHLLGNLNGKDLNEWLSEIPDGNAWLGRICGASVDDVAKWRQGTPFPHQQQNIRNTRLMHLAALNRAGDESLVDYAELNKRLSWSGNKRGGYQSVHEMCRDYVEARKFIDRYSDC
jgi:hypothetical protein